MEMNRIFTRLDIFIQTLLVVPLSEARLNPSWGLPHCKLVPPHGASIAIPFYEERVLYYQCYTSLDAMRFSPRKATNRLINGRARASYNWCSHKHTGERVITHLPSFKRFIRKCIS